MAQLQLEQLELLAVQLEQVGDETVDRQVSGWESAGSKNTHRTDSYVITSVSS